MSLYFFLKVGEMYFDEISDENSDSQNVRKTILFYQNKNQRFTYEMIICYAKQIFRSTIMITGSTFIQWYNGLYNVQSVAWEHKICYTKQF